MNIYFPKNIFTEVIRNSVNEEIASQISFHPSSLIARKIIKDSGSVGLIPTMDLLGHKDLFVSKSFGISFEESLCNSYLYFQTHGASIKEVNLLGDLSSNEAIIGKLIMRELYGVDVQMNLLTGSQNQDNKDIISVGDINFENDKFLSGISFAEEVIEVLSLPYVNFILVSTEKSALENFHSSIGNIQPQIYLQVEVENFGNSFSEKTKMKIKEDISSFVCGLDDQDRDGIDQLLRLAFYHEMISEIIEVKFI